MMEHQTIPVFRRMENIVQRGRIRHEQSWQRTSKTAFTREAAYNLYKNLRESPFNQIALLHNRTRVADRAFDIKTNVNDVTCETSNCAVFCFKLEVETAEEDRTKMLDHLINGVFLFLENMIANGQSLSVSAAFLDPNESILVLPNPMIVEVAVMIDGITS